MIHLRLLKLENFFYILIGANDGIRADDKHSLVKDKDLKGIVIEPLPDMYTALVNNCADCDGVVAVNAAIGNVDGLMTLYRVDPDFKDAPDWCHGIASFDKRHLVKASGKVAGIVDHLLEQSVPCMTFPCLARKYGFSKIDLLQIDTEGYDFELIKSIDFDLLEPTIVRYEDSGLSPEDSTACLNFLMGRGCKIIEERNDIVAVKL